MLKVRLARGGKTNDPVYRVVVSEDSKRPTGEVLEVLGFWHPKPGLKTVNKKAIEAWHKKDAQISKPVKKLMEETS